MEQNEYIRFSVTLPKEHAKALRHFCDTHHNKQTLMVRAVMMKWIEKFAMEDYQKLKDFETL